MFVRVPVDHLIKYIFDMIHLNVYANPCRPCDKFAVARVTVLSLESQSVCVCVSYNLLHLFHHIFTFHSFTVSTLALRARLRHYTLNRHYASNRHTHYMLNSMGKKLVVVRLPFATNSFPLKKKQFKKKSEMTT